MENTFLGPKGLSITQAQSVSNLANQKAQSIKDDLNRWQIIKNTIKIDGTVHVLNHGVELSNSAVTEMLEEVGNLHALQAFLMFNLKSRENEMEEIEGRIFEWTIIDKENKPVRPHSIPRIEFPNERTYDPLTAKERAEYLAAEAHASHVGQFIHKGEHLDLYRKNYYKLMDFDTRTYNSVVYPVTKQEKVSKNALDALHESLSIQHREYNQRVNYFKAKVKNMLDAEIQRISVANNKIDDENHKIYEQFGNKLDVWLNKQETAKSKARSEFDAQLSSDLNAFSKLRITIPEEYKELTNSLMGTTQAK